MCSSMKYRCVSFSCSIAFLPECLPGVRARCASGSARGLSARWRRDRDPRRQIANDLRSRAVGVKYGQRPATVRGIVARLRVRHDDLALAAEETRDVVHLHAGAARSVHDENRALLRIGELLEDLERLLRCLE